MRKAIIILTSLLFISACGMENCNEQIKIFYTAYLNEDNNNATHEALCRKYLTPELIEKLERVRNVTGADPIIRAQDVNKEAQESVSVTSLSKGWYLVSYFWKKGDVNTITEIPIKAEKINGECKIIYITPEWHGKQYGDELFCCTKTGKIDQTSVRAFLQSFYQNYTSLYINIPKGLRTQLAAMRSKYLSSNAMKQFNDTERENADDGYPGYDLLINNFDFDCLWYNSIKISPLEGDVFEVLYNIGDETYKVRVTVKKTGDHYLIEDLSL